MSAIWIMPLFPPDIPPLKLPLLSLRILSMKIDAALDRIRSKYGKDAVKRRSLMEQALPQASSHEEGSRNT